MNTIVSWSPIHGQAGNTSNTMALATHMALSNSNLRSLLTHNLMSLSTLEGILDKEQSSKFDDKGMDALGRLVRSNLLKGEAIQDYTSTVIPKRLDFLSGSKRAYDTSEKEIIWRRVLDVAKQHYDLIWIDLHAGDRQALTKSLLSEADLIVVNLPQNNNVLERFFSGEDFPEELKGKKYIVVIGMYDAEVTTLSVKNIKRKYKVNAPIFPISYSSQYRNAANNKRVEEFFYMGMKRNKQNPSYTFINDVQSINEYIQKEFFKKNDWEEDEEDWA